MRSKMTIGKKLFLSFGAALALTLVVSALSLLGMGNLGKDLDKLVNVNARKLLMASQMDTRASELVAAERGIMARAYMKDKASMEQYNQDFRTNLEALKKLWADFAPLIETDQARRSLEEMKANGDRLAPYHEELWQLANTDKVEDASQVLKDKVMPVAVKLNDLATQATAEQEGVMAGVTKAAQASVSQSRWITISMIVFSLLVAAVVVFIVRQINSSLRKAVTELSEGAEQTASAASQVSSSSQSLAQGSSEQAASLEETSASSEEINSMARKNSENSRVAADLMSQSQQKFTQANQSLDQSVVAMAEINTQSDKISKIIKVIDEIAFQTNILALNAAVEAARAGEAGMGFAVVADEVRNLAQRCAQAAKDTSALIEESIAKSNDGKTKVDQVAVAIRAVTEESSKVKTLVDEVNLGSQEQARGIEQIGKAISQMEQVTQKTAANAEESASAAEELNAQSETLKDVVERLTAMVGGGEAANGGARQTRRRSAKTSAPHQQRESATGLAALRKAVSHPVGEKGAPVHLTRGAPTKDAFPLEEQFKEF